MSTVLLIRRNPSSTALTSSTCVGHPFAQYNMFNTVIVLSKPALQKGSQTLNFIHSHIQ